MQYTRIFIILGLLVGLGAATGCMCPHNIAEFKHHGDKDADLIKTSHNAIDCLLQQAPGLDPTKRVLVATAVDLDNLNRTSRFGRMIGEFLATRLTQRGHMVVHATARKGSLAINEEGQFLLSRDIKKLASDYRTGSVLVSTYSLSPDRVFVSLKLVMAESQCLLSAVDFELPRGPETNALLNGSTTYSMHGVDSAGNGASQLGSNGNGGYYGYR